MKKAEKIYQNNYNLDRDEDDNEVFYRWQVLDAIKEAQEDAIRETVNECAKNAKIGYESVLWDDPKEGEDAYVDTPIIYKQSILSVADKLIKEL